MDNQQLRPQGKVQRPSRKRVDLQAFGKSKWCASHVDEDMVYSHIKV